MTVHFDVGGMRLHRDTHTLHEAIKEAVFALEEKTGVPLKIVDDEGREIWLREQMPIDEFAKMNQIPTNRPAQAVLRGDAALRFPHDLRRMLLEASGKDRHPRDRGA